MENKIQPNQIINRSNTSMLLNYLEGTIADEMILNSYIRDINVVDADNTTIVIQAPSIQSKHIIENEYKNEFLQAIESVYQKPLELRLILAGERVAFENKMSRTSMNISKKFTFDTYVESDFNKEVVDMAKRVIKNPGKYSPFYITSKSGLGKTHLLHAMGNALEEDGYTSIYVEPNKFTKSIQMASKEGGSAISDLADSYKGYDVLLFDDIQNLGDRSVTLRVLFEIINHHISNDKQVVVVSDKVAQELSGFEERFITRFVSGISSTIKDPSPQDIENILLFKLKEENMRPEEWEQSALSLVARNNTSSIRALEGSIKRIAYYTENDHNVKYTYTVISNIFKDLSVNPSELTPSRIIGVVANYYKINKKDIIGKSRKKLYVTARHIAIYLVREITKMGYVDIGKAFGGRDHSTIISAVRSVDQNMNMDKAIKMAVSALEQKVRTIT